MLVTFNQCLLSMPFSLKNYNTFGIEADCSELIEINNVDELIRALSDARQKQKPVYLLGGGSNILLTRRRYAYRFLKNNIKGMEVVEDTPSSKTIKFGGGEIWQDAVEYAIKNNLGGIENLSLIPGTMGAAPIQNIGAYGVELKDVFVKLEAVSLETYEVKTFNKDDCQFDYRNSVFKNTLKGKFCITQVYLELKKQSAVDTHQLQLGYGDIQRVLKEKKIVSPTIQDVSKAVIEIRQSKLPDPKHIGNAGSFFKNPEIGLTELNNLKQKFPDIINFPTANGSKLAAAWLIDQCGWKGKRRNNIGVHDRQALVIVNYGDGTGSEIKKLCADIQKSVQKKFGITLSPEVNFVE